jgi:hypothetical protein
MIQLRKENLKRLPISIGCQPRLHLNANFENGQCAVFRRMVLSRVGGGTYGNLNWRQFPQPPNHAPAVEDSWK